MKGLNVKVDILRRTQSADDAVGGSVRSDLPRYSGVDARISNKAQPTILASQGFESTQLHQIILYPDSYPDIETEDVVVPTSGRWTGARFRVMEVQPSSVIDGGSRAHTQLMCKRVRYADDNVPEASEVQSYDPVVSLAFDITATVNNGNYASTGDPIRVGDIVQIDGERMIISIFDTIGNIIFFIRGWQDTVPAAHSAGTEIFIVGEQQP